MSGFGTQYGTQYGLEDSGGEEPAPPTPPPVGVQYDVLVLKGGIPTPLGTDALRADRVAKAALTTSGLDTGDVCQLAGTNTLGKASNASLTPVVGVYEGVSGSVVRSGAVVASFIGGLTLVAGDLVYVSSTAGKLTNVKPTTGMLHIVGVVLDPSTSKILLLPRRVVQFV